MADADLGPTGPPRKDQRPGTTGTRIASRSARPATMWCMSDERASADQDLVRIYSSGSVSDIQLAKGRLEAEGVPAMIKGDAEGGTLPAGVVFLFVPRSFEEDAKAILGSVSELTDAELEAAEEAAGEDPGV